MDMGLFVITRKLADGNQFFDCQFGEIGRKNSLRPIFVIELVSHITLSYKKILQLKKLVTNLETDYLVIKSDAKIVTTKSLTSLYLMAIEKFETNCRQIEFI